VFGRPKIDRSDVAAARSALEEAQGPDAESGPVTALVQRVLAVALDGVGFVKGAEHVAARALSSAGGDVERAIDRVAKRGVRNAAGGGFVTGLGGFVTLPVAVPTNVVEFYVIATRTVGTIAALRGYDVKDQTIRTAILLTLVGTRSGDILKLAGVSTTGALGDLAGRGIPKAAVMVIDKAVGFRMLRSLTEATLARFGRAVPILGGGIGAIMDATMMSRIARQARREFPAVARPHDWGVL
jgi:hypothetical protein